MRKVDNLQLKQSKCQPLSQAQLFEPQVLLIQNNPKAGLIHAKINLDFFVGGARVLENFWQFIPNRNKKMLDD